MDEKIVTKHPQGKSGVNISKAKYETIKTAIVDTLQENEPMTFSALTEQGNQEIGGKSEKFEVPVNYYAK